MGNRVIGGVDGLATPSVGALDGLTGPVGPAQAGGGGGDEIVTVVVRKDTTLDFWGYLADRTTPTPPWSITPDPFPINSVDLERIYADVGNTRWEVRVVGSGHPQDLFDSVTIEHATGAFVTLNSADAVSFIGGNRWVWTANASNIWNSSDNGASRTAEFVWS